MGSGGSKNKIEKTPISLPKNIISCSKSIIEIKIDLKYSFGFLILMSKEDADFFCFITLKENIPIKMIEKKETIKFYYDNRKKSVKISLNSNERFIKDFSYIGINSILIQILPGDNINKDYFLLPVKHQNKEFNDFKNEEITLIQSLKEEINYFKGKIQEIDNYQFIHSITDNSNSPGNPIFLWDSAKVIGIQKSSSKIDSKYNADFIGPINYYFKNYVKENKTNKEEVKIEANKEETKEIKGKKEGNKILYENGEYYIGEEKEGKRHGKGTLYNKYNNIKYEGDWVEDKYEGKGKLIEVADCKYYIGEFKKGKKQGNGIDYYGDEKKYYEGDYNEDLKEGNGKRVYDNENYYIGEWKKDKEHGKGKLYEKNNKIIYEGNFFNGTYYIGEIKDNKKNGKGILYCANGEIIYDGEFIDDQFEGKGKLIEEYGDYYYIGEFKDGKKHGKGIIYDKEGIIRYEGDFIDGLYDGNGEFNFLDYYIGQFKKALDMGKELLNPLKKGKSNMKEILLMIFMKDMEN